MNNCCLLCDLPVSNEDRETECLPPVCIHRICFDLMKCQIEARSEVYLRENSLESLADLSEEALERLAHSDYFGID